MQNTSRIHRKSAIVPAMGNNESERGRSAKSTTKKSKKIEIRNGFIYPAINTFVGALRYLCLVELFKFIGVRAARSVKENEISYSRLAVDIFMVAKWLFLAGIWVFEVRSNWAAIAIWYLLTTNVYSYFYYHSWCKEILLDPHFYADRVKRRFNSLILAISYSVFGFAYLYSIPYANDFVWAHGTPTFLQSMWFSISTSLTAGYDQVKPATDAGYSISMIQLLMMFIFLTIIISGSIPQTNQINKEG